MIQASVLVKLPNGFSSASATVAAVFDTNIAKISFDSRGRSPSGNVSVKITAPKGSANALVRMTIKNHDLVAGFVNSGLMVRAY